MQLSKAADLNIYIAATHWWLFRSRPISTPGIEFILPLQSILYLGDYYPSPYFR